MKLKDSRRVIGTFSQVATLIRSFSQILYNQIKNPENPYWKWILLIRKFLRFVSMSQVSSSQLAQMDACLCELMNTRLRLTKVATVGDTKPSDNCSEQNESKDKKKPKYKPPLRYKEHALSHFKDDVENLAPLALLNTDFMESKVYMWLSILVKIYL